MRWPPPKFSTRALGFKERLKIFATAEGWTGPNELLLTAARR